MSCHTMEISYIPYFWYVLCVSKYCDFVNLAPGKKFRYFTFAFCSEYANAIVGNLYVEIIILRSIIHSQKSQYLNPNKIYQKYGMNPYQKWYILFTLYNCQHHCTYKCNSSPITNTYHYHYSCFSFI